MRATFLLLTVILALALSVAGQDPREAELASIRAEIGRLEMRLRRMKTRESGVSAELERTRVELQLQEQQVAEATAARDLAVARVALTETKIDELQLALEEVREDLRGRLEGLYRLGRHGYLRLFLSLEPDQNLLPAIRQLRFLAQRDRQALDRFAATRDALDEQRQHLEARRQEALEWQAREIERRRQLADLHRRQEALVARLARERQRLAERTDRLQDKERKLTRLIASLVGSDQQPLAGTPIEQFRGALDWPLRGEVLERFGPRRDPRYKTEVPHKGIDIAVTTDRRVRAIFPGEILFSDAFEGYGKMIVVRHPGRVFTLYARLAELRSAKGDMVSLGELLGVSSEQLYFEVRSENQPQDPLEWLR